MLLTSFKVVFNCYLSSCIVQCTITPSGFGSRMVLLLRLGDFGRTCLFRILFNCGMVAALGGNIVQLLDWHAVFFIFYVPTSSTTLRLVSAPILILKFLNKGSSAMSYATLAVALFLSSCFVCLYTYVCSIYVNYGCTHMSVL